MRHARLTGRCLVVSAVLGSSPAIAQTITGVSGTILDGESLSISGSDFGSGPTVLVFDDFEGGTDGEPLSLDLAPLGAWDSVQSPAWTSYSSAERISGNLAARFDSDGYPPNQHPNVHTDAPVPFDSFYISWWGLIPAGDIFPGCGYGGCNWKTIWVADVAGTVNTGDVTVSANGIDAWAIFGNSYPYEYSPYLGVEIPNGTWHRFQFYVKGRTDATGEERIWLTTADEHTRLVKNRDRQTLAVGHESVRQRFYVNGYVRDTPTSRPTFDDVYIAYGEAAQARVEIGNADTYEGCNRLSMCTPTSWQTSSITCTVRQGGLTGAAGWVYVTDASGNRSAGAEAVGGGAGGAGAGGGGASDGGGGAGGTGTAASGGAGAAAGAGAGAAPSASGDDDGAEDGCGCAVPGGPREGAGLWWLAALGWAGARRRRLRLG